MLNKLKKIPMLDNIHISTDDGILRMQVEGRIVRGYLCTLSLVLSIFIDTNENFPRESIEYITLLLTGCPKVHDYALQLNPAGGWLCCSYDRDMTTENMAIEIEKHLALTRYLASILSCQRNILK